MGELLAAPALDRLGPQKNAYDTLLAVARMQVVGGNSAGAVDAIRRAFVAAPISDRGAIIDEPLFASLHGEAAFRRLFRGFPVFEARLRRS